MGGMGAPSFRLHRKGGLLRSNRALKARQRRLRGQIQSRNRIAIQQHLMNRIGPQPRRVVGIRIAAGDREHPLRQKLLQREGKPDAEDDAGGDAGTGN